MCDRTWGSDPAHPQFWPNCLTNEEEMENTKNSSIFQKKNVYERKDSLQSKELSGVKIDALDW